MQTYAYICNMKSSIIIRLKKSKVRGQHDNYLTSQLGGAIITRETYFRVVYSRRSLL